MKPLAKEFRKYGMVYRFVERQQDIAIYSLALKEKPDVIVGHDTVIVQWHNGYEIAGNKIPPAECYPSSEMWGSKAWSFNKLETAKNKMNELLNREPKQKK